jgi:hypothetical protein
MKTDELIADLAGHVTPVRPLPSPGRRAIAWFALASACAAAGVAIFGARPDVMIRLTQADYLWTIALASVASLLAVLVALVLAIPGAEQTPTLRRSTVGIFVVWAVTMAGAVVVSGRGLPFTTDPHWPACFARVVVISAVPVVVLFAMARRAAPLRLGWTAAFAGAASASIAALAVQLACPLDDAGHAFLGHFVPVLVITAIGVGLRRTLNLEPRTRNPEPGTRNPEPGTRNP